MKQALKSIYPVNSCFSRFSAMIRIHLNKRRWSLPIRQVFMSGKEQFATFISFGERLALKLA